jgi:predicted Na+-dependent transporter
MQIISRYFGFFLLLSCLVGLMVPSAGNATPLIVILSLAFIIFCSYFHMNFTAESLITDFKISFQFWLLRYVLMPVVIFFALKWISDFYAQVLILSFLLPAAVSSPSFSVIFNGKPDLSLKILIYSSFLAVLTIPFIMYLLLGATIHISTGKMLLTLVYTIVIPFIVHLPLRRFRRMKDFIGHNNALFTLIGLVVIFIFVTARNKPAILENPALVVLFAIEALILYSFMYLTGYFLFPSQTQAVRRTFSISSGANNIGLGVTITALFFPGNMNVFFIVSQLAWVVMLIPLRRMMADKRLKIED